MVKQDDDLRKDQVVLDTIDLMSRILEKEAGLTLPLVTYKALPTALDAGIPTPLSPLFLGRFSPVLRRFSAVILCCLASWRRDGENGRKMAENGRNLGEKRARNSGG